MITEFSHHGVGFLWIQRVDLKGFCNFSEVFSHGFVGWPKSIFVDIMFEILEESIGGLISEFQILGERFVQDFVECLIDPGIESAEIRG
jgi:hypothetical protein